LFTFNRKYFIIAVIIFFIEVIIALYVKDRIIRPYFGDYLVVILLYCAARAFVELPVLKLCIGVLIFAYFIEWLQYMNIIQVLGLQHNKTANIVIGNRFEWIDMLAYTLGVLSVYLIEKSRLFKST